jgi:hypothetical protein
MAGSEPVAQHAQAWRLSPAAWFKGKQLSLNEQAIPKVSKVITSRVNDTMVDRLAKIMSSNNCEGFFGQLTKHTEGRRKQHLAASLEVIVYIVAGMRSDPDIATRILVAAGGANTSVVRDKYKTYIRACKGRNATGQKTS